MEQFWHPWWLAVILPVWLISLALVQWWTRRRLLFKLAQEGLGEEGLADSLPDPRPEDQAARELIRAYRRRFLWKLWPETEFGFQAVNDLSLTLIKEIAQVYHPGEDRPELKASLADLVALHNRVGERLQAWLESFPLRAFKDVELKTVLRYHEIYQSVRNHPGYLFLKRYHLDKAARLAWAVNNYANPWYWGRQAAYTGGKEAVTRLFMAKVVALVGEEALRVYGRRVRAA
jgi:hypothetical protein